jgi:hypothetical protein
LRGRIHGSVYWKVLHLQAVPAFETHYAWYKGVVFLLLEDKTYPKL